MNKDMKYWRAVLATLLLALSSSAAHAVLVNPGFETGDFTGWTVALPGGGGGSAVALDGTPIPGAVAPFPPAFQNVRSGQYGANAALAYSAGEYLSLSQNVLIGTAGSYLTGFYMGNDSANGFGINQAIANNLLAIYVDGINVGFDTRFPANSFPVGSTPADMREFSTDVFYSAGAHTVEFRISGSGTSRAGISVDDFFLTASAVPEPTTLLLLGLGLAGLGFVRRHSS